MRRSDAAEVQDPLNPLPPPGKKRRSRLVLWLAAVLIVLVVSAVYRPPLAVIAPAPALDLSGDVTIQGVPSHKARGKFLLVAVSLAQPSALVDLFAAFDSKLSVIPVSNLIPKGVSEKQFDRVQRQMFVESRMMAAAAAAKAAGLPVSSTGEGATILDVLTTAPAGRVLKKGDLVTELNGAPIATALDLRRVASATAPGTKLEVGLQRQGKALTVSTSTIKLPKTAGSPSGIGVLTETKNLKVNLPFEVKFKERPNIGGPSAGLVYALEISDMLGQNDLARGRTIAASGTIQSEGKVGEVGGLDQKAVAAQRAGASILLVPSSELAHLKKTSLKLKGVDTLEAAIKALQAA